MKSRIAGIILSCLAGVAMLSGCGGGGSGSGGGGGGGAGTARGRIFLTDDLNAGFSNVWVSIKKIELVATVGGTTQVVYNDPNGVQVDLKTLRDASGAKFQFLQSSSIQRNSYSGIRVTVDKNLVVTSTGSAVGTAATFAGSGATSFTMELVFPFPRAIGVNGDDFIIDFDLSRWTLAGNVVSATGLTFIKQGESTGITDLSRHEARNYKGTVSNISGTAPTQTFTVSDGSNLVVVATSSTTKVTSNNGTVDPLISNGVQVVVRGVLNPTTSILSASKVKLMLDPSSSAVRARAKVLGTNETQITMVITDAEGFLPNQPLIVDVGLGGLYFGSKGNLISNIQFQSLLSVGSVIELEGSLNGNMFNVSKAKLEDGIDDSSVKGGVTLVNAQNGTFTITASEVDSAPIQLGTQVKVTTLDSTVFQMNGIVMTRSQFFTTFANGQTAKAEGVYNPDTQTIAAIRVRV